MQVNWKVFVTVLVATAVGFVFQSNGPVGKMIWPMGIDVEPVGANLALLIVMSVVEALAFGFGVAFLLFGWPLLRRFNVGSKAFVTAVYLSIAWGLVNWVPHTALHMNHGNITKPEDFGGLVAIEYGFHLTLVVAAAFIATFFLRVAKGRGAAASVPAAQATATPA